MWPHSARLRYLNHVIGIYSDTSKLRLVPVRWPHLVASGTQVSVAMLSPIMNLVQVIRKPSAQVFLKRGLAILYVDAVPQVG